jgi:hypothetical protein
MTIDRILDVKQFLLGLMKQRIDEAKALKNAGGLDDAVHLLDEADLLRDAFDAIQVEVL